MNINLKDKIKDTLKMTSSITISSIILLNCFCFLLNMNNNPKKKNTQNDFDNEPIMAYSLDDSIMFTSNKEKEKVSKPTLKPPFMVTKQDKEELIESLGKKLCDDPLFDLQLNNEVYNLMVEMGVIEKEKTNDEKLAWILENYHLTQEEFDTFKGVVLAEAGPESYIECYAVANTVFNRCICSRWANEIMNTQGSNTLYNQVIQPGQFTVYFYGQRSYRFYVDETPETSPGVQAIIDFLYGTFTKNPDTWEVTWNGPARLHDYVNFVSRGSSPSYAYEMFTSRGNKHGVHIKDSEYMTSQFTTTSIGELQVKANEAKEYIANYQEYIKGGKKEEEAKLLARTK